MAADLSDTISVAHSIPSSFETTLPNPFLGKSDALASEAVVDSLLDTIGPAECLSAANGWHFMQERVV